MVRGATTADEEVCAVCTRPSTDYAFNVSQFNLSLCSDAFKIKRCDRNALERTSPQTCRLSDRFPLLLDGKEDRRCQGEQEETFKLAVARHRTCSISSFELL